MMTKDEIKNEYGKFVQKQEDGTIILPLIVQIEIFWKLYPNGAIANKLPEKKQNGRRDNSNLPAVQR